MPTRHGGSFWKMPTHIDASIAGSMIMIDLAFEPGAAIGCSRSQRVSRLFMRPV